jgi:tetratricopeptide repeat protein
MKTRCKARRWRPGAEILVLAISVWLCSPLGQARASEPSPAAVAVALVQGKLAFQQGDYQLAAELLEEAVASDPEEGTALHWLGLAYVKLGRTDDAIDRLKRSRNADHPPAAGKKRVSEDLRLVEEAQAKGLPLPEIAAPEEDLVFHDPTVPDPWNAWARISLGTDSNPGLLPETVTGLPLLGGGPHTAKADAVAQLDLHLDLVPFFDRKGWSLGVSLAGSRSMHRDFGDLDLAFAQGQVSLAWGGDPRGYLAGPLGSVQVPYTASRFSAVLQGDGFDLRLGSDDYLRVAELGGSLVIREGLGKRATRIDSAARNRSFRRGGPEPHRRSGGEAFLEVSEYFYFGRPDRHLRLGIAAGERGGGRDFESSFSARFAELSLPLAGSESLLLRGDWHRERFAHLESRLGASGPRREDTFWKLAADAIWRLRNNLRWTLGGAYVRNDSNLELTLGGPLFDYRRTLVSTGFLWSYR